VTADSFNLSAVLLDDHIAAGRGDRPALRYEGATLSYRDVSRLVARAGNALRSLGIEMEDRVALLLPDSPEFVATFLGAIRIGAAPVTPRLRNAFWKIRRNCRSSSPYW